MEHCPPGVTLQNIPWPKDAFTASLPQTLTPHPTTADTASRTLQNSHRELPFLRSVQERQLSARLNQRLRAQELKCLFCAKAEHQPVRRRGIRQGELRWSQCPGGDAHTEQQLCSPALPLFTKADGLKNGGTAPQLSDS